MNNCAVETASPRVRKGVVAPSSTFVHTCCLVFSGEKMFLMRFSETWNLAQFFNYVD